MAYDLLIKNGKVIDGSGMPAFRGDVGVKNGKIVDIGKLSGQATKVVDADGLAVSPGFIDNHCHYDAQVTWDPICSFSPHHGVTSVIIGNCSLALAPVRPGKGERLAEFLSFVEAIPMEVLSTVDFSWETIPQYMDTVEKRVGVNMGMLIGHSAVRYYVMGDECQSREATGEEIKAQQEIVHEAMTAGALGLSVSQHGRHYDPQGVLIPAAWANEEEIFSLGGVLTDLSTGVIQFGGGQAIEMKNRMTSRLSEATGRTVLFTHLGQQVSRPDAWKQLMQLVDESTASGIRSYPLASPNRSLSRFTMRNCQLFIGIPTWHPILLASDDEKVNAYRDPEVRKKLHAEVVEWSVDIKAETVLARNWYDYVYVGETVLEKNKPLKDKSISQIAKEQGKGIIDTFLDLALEENLDTLFLSGTGNVDNDAMKTILNYPSAIVGLSDSGAHVQFGAGYGFCTNFLSYWVREQQIMSLEKAVYRLTFESASAFGIYDRGLLRPGLAADITVFDPDTVKALPRDEVHDYPAGGWRVRELAEGIKATIVNGEVLMEDGTHTGAMPGRVLRNSAYHANGK